MHKVAIVFGTRPEAIKLAPVVRVLQNSSDFQVRVAVTAQHRQMLDQVLEAFELHPDVDLDLMQPGQRLAGLTAAAVTSIDTWLESERPNIVVVQGDTTTAFAAALAAFYQRIPVAHVEAGLRTWNMASPWPEEMNRVLVSRLATLHFAPTNQSRDNLRVEGISPDLITVTGNTVVDALHIAVQRLESTTDRPDALSFPTQRDGTPSRVVLITGHRRENFGGRLESMCDAIGELAREFSTVHFVYPVHLNPNVRNAVDRVLTPIARKLGNVHLVAPMPYLPFVELMRRSTLVITDSGGIQEEAPTFGIPVLITRDTTERPEAVAAGVASLVGSSRAAIVRTVRTLLTDPSAYATMSRAANPFGDGHASERIAERLKAFLDSPNHPPPQRERPSA